MIQWTGDNLTEVLAYTGHKDVVINSFGDPCVWNSDVQFWVVCEKYEWIRRDDSDKSLGVFQYKAENRL